MSCTRKTKRTHRRKSEKRRSRGRTPKPETNAKQLRSLLEWLLPIEVEFRGLKQTLDRAKLRCRDSHRLLAELNWSPMAMTLAELFALKEQLAPSGSPSSSIRSSHTAKSIWGH